MNLFLVIQKFHQLWNCLVVLRHLLILQKKHALTVGYWYLANPHCHQHFLDSSLDPQPTVLLLPIEFLQATALLKVHPFISFLNLDQYLIDHFMLPILKRKLNLVKPNVLTLQFLHQLTLWG